MSISSFLFLQYPFLSYENLLKPPLKHHPVFCPLYLCIVVTKKLVLQTDGEQDRLLLINLKLKNYALNYEVKKRVFGFDETKTEKYVAQMKTLGVVGFKDLCDEVSKIGMAPRGVVKLVLDGLIDTLNMDINKGFSVQLGEFGCFRPGINAKSQDKLEDVTASTIYRRKIIFTPGFYFRDMLTRASVEKMDWSGNGTVSGGGSSKPNPVGGGSDGDQGENPLG